MAFAKQTVRDLEPAGKRAFVRVDFNVPLRDGEVSDDTRMVAALPTIRYLIEKRARLVLASHLGRPKTGPDAAFSLRPVATRLERLLRQPVGFAPDCIGTPTEAAARALRDGEVLVLENVRFHPEEEKNDPAFARGLAALAECYVNDAFGSAHRAHASTEGVARLLRPAVAGFLMQKELESLGRLLDEPARPFVAILGGAKISGKIDVISALLERVDRLLIGGAMMFTFLKAQGRPVGRSLVEDDRLDVARRVLEHARARRVELALPVDCVASRAPDGSAPGRTTRHEELGDDEMGVDIGPGSVRLFREQLRGARTILWNGPMGIFEVKAFAEGTYAMARALAEATSQGAVTVVGGGDSVAAVQEVGLAERLTHVSTGGGASLELLEGRTLPGVAVLDDRAA